MMRVFVSIVAFVYYFGTCSPFLRSTDLGHRSPLDFSNLLAAHLVPDRCVGEAPFSAHTCGLPIGDRRIGM
jgi:hypothetical protein